MNRQEVQAKLAQISPDSEEAVELQSMLLFDELGWNMEYAGHETDGDPTLLGREHQGEVVLKRYLEQAIRKFNPKLPSQAITLVIDQIARDRSAMTIARANQDVMLLLRDGVKVEYRDSKGNSKIERAHLMDWNKPDNNHFLIVSQLWVAGDPYRRRPDLVGFVNGLPLLFIELKAPDQNIKHAFTDNLRDYKDTISQIFWYNGFVMLSNGSDAKVGSVTAPWEHFCDWKKINDEEEAGVVDLPTAIRGTCEKSRFMDIIENFCIFMEASGGLNKLVAKNHQYLGVNNSIQAVLDSRNNQGRLGVFWHTQGSGKSASMMFFSQKVLRKIPGNWTFLIVTDRTELDNQIYESFQNAGVVTEGHAQATSSMNLRQLLSEDHRFIFTLIHKFKTVEGEIHPVLSERDDIIIMTDEAHRSQYDVLAQNMRVALPNAAFLGFTGTPLIKASEERTKEVFGDYVSVYNFRQSIEDKATVPLYYENRIPEVQLTNENLNEEINRIVDEAMLDSDQETKIERNFSRMYQVVTRDERLEKIANDIVEHFMNRGHRGKAMFVAIDKATAIRMYDKVQAHWKDYLGDLKAQTSHIRFELRDGHAERIRFMEETDMAVVISSSQNEIDDMRRREVDIAPHRERMNRDDLATMFKDSDNPFRIVFVCAMWMTGFDVPSCSTIYIDKPMSNHTLMQTIARANRVHGDKVCGLIVDYVGILRNLEKALAIYAEASDDGELPIKDKVQLKEELLTAIMEVCDWLINLEVDLDKIRRNRDVFERTALKSDAVEAILVNDTTKKEFMRLAAVVNRLYKAYLPDPIEAETAETAYLIRKISKQIRSMQPDVDISDVMLQVEELLDKSVAGFDIEEPEGGVPVYDLSNIDFGKLKKGFEAGRKRAAIEQIRNSITIRINRMIVINQTRMNFKEKFEDLVDDYNNPSVSLDNIFQQLLDFNQELDEEEQRHIKENLKDEQELTVYDILTKPDMKLSDKETRNVKKVARTLLTKLRDEKLGILDWRKKQQTRAGVKVTIEKELDGLPGVYSKNIYTQKCSDVYNFVYDSDFGIA